MSTKETLNTVSLSGTITIKDHPISDEKVLKIVTIIMGSESAYEDRLSGNHQPMQGDVGNANAQGMPINQGNAPHPKAFMAQKKPSSEIERLICLAYYLTHHRNTTAFKTRDITKLNIEASQPAFSNPTIFARNAVQAQYLATAGGGSKQITSLGEDIVRALPDREKVKMAIAEHRSGRSRRVRKNKKKSAA